MIRRFYFAPLAIISCLLLGGSSPPAIAQTRDKRFAPSNAVYPGETAIEGVVKKIDWRSHLLTIAAVSSQGPDRHVQPINPPALKTVQCAPTSTIKHPYWAVN